MNYETDCESDKPLVVQIMSNYVEQSIRSFWVIKTKERKTARMVHIIIIFF